MRLTEQEEERYRRQMQMEGWGPATQERLKSATAFIAGAGGLGSPAAMYLAVAGVGQLRVCDFDAPDLSNLNRQILHDTSRIGTNKAESARDTLLRLNEDIEVMALSQRIEADNVDELVGKADIIVDCMDNFPTRYLLDACAQRKGIPLIHGSVWGMDGRLTVIQPPETPCLRCLFPEAPPKEVFPVLGATPGVIGALQAMECVKCLTGLGKPLKGRLLVWEGATAQFRHFRARRNPECESCSRA